MRHVIMASFDTNEGRPVRGNEADIKYLRWHLLACFEVKHDDVKDFRVETRKAVVTSKPLHRINDRRSAN